jgi:NAD(P)-dependent dehydrogenase (short-subunit alcohol dehydrogenase family)
VTHSQRRSARPGIRCATGEGLRRQQKAELTARTPLGGLGRPRDAANLIALLCSAEGGWVNGQLLHSNGGIQVHQASFCRGGRHGRPFSEG